MKKIRMIALVLAMTLTAGLLTACSMGGGSKTEVKVQEIGVIQIVKHEALDKSYEGFVDGLKEAGYVDGENIKIDYQVAADDIAICNSIADKFVTAKKDLVLAIATPSAQAMISKTKEIPVLITAVTDPLTAELVVSNEKPGGNLTGTSDLSPVKQQIELLKEIRPEAKKLGLLYSSNEANSKFLVEIAKKEAKALGYETVEATISKSNDLQVVAESLAGKVDAIYAPTDNKIAAGMSIVSAAARKNSIPVICGEEGMVAEGGIITLGMNYYELGKRTAAMAVKVIKGEAKPADMPIEYLLQEELEVKINEEEAKLIGITFPKSILDRIKK